MSLIHQDHTGAGTWWQLYAAGFRAITFSAGPHQSVITAVHDDPDLTREQQEALEELYTAFRDVTRDHRRTTN